MAKARSIKRMSKKLISLRVVDRYCCKCKSELTINNVDKSRLRTRTYVCRSCENLRKNKRKLELKLTTLKKYGGKCVCCGESNQIFLTIDHIDGSGAVERKKLSGRSRGSGGYTFYCWLKKQNYPKNNYQILCFNCNFAKYVLGKCPHQESI